MFLTASLRKSRVQYIPQHLSQWAKHLKQRGKIDVFWGSCTPPDHRGIVSLGPGCCYESEILRHAEFVVLEVNPRLPRTGGSTLVKASDVDVLIPYESEIPKVHHETPDATDREIAKHIAALIPDGATLQLGIGGIPNAVALQLTQKNDLGIHTEMINDAMAELFTLGVISGKHKTIWPEKMVGAFAFGSQKLYDFIDQNPMVELHPASVVNDPYRIGRNFRMISINTAVEIDLTGQVCSESVGHRELSGVGGATDTHIGAQRSPEGRGIIALRSQLIKNNAIKSKIVCELTPGAKVSISRNDLDTVVTEFGIAEMKGRSVEHRVRSMISIAHPDHRQDLEEAAKKCGYIR